MKSTITTHVLDTSRGKPAAGVPVTLEVERKPGDWKEVATGKTNSDGRVEGLLPSGSALAAGSYRFVFDTGSYFSSHGTKSIFLTVIIPFEINDVSEHYHIPLLLSPYGYSTYRGS